ncbi:MAG: BON domain-containing protein [Armatimonadetes bacterium]|nr:BON domain-containing protein [Armatimonadota bacterium]
MGVREAALEVAVRSRLSEDKRIGDLPISPYVVDNVVYLIGRVNTLEQRDIALFLARGTPGVRKVYVDELEVGEVERARTKSNNSQQIS